MLRRKNGHEIHQLSAEEKMLSSFVLIWGGSDQKNEIWMEYLLQLSCFAVGGDKNSSEMAFVRSIQCLLRPEAVDSPLRSACLRLATAEYRDSETEVDRLERASGPTAAGK